MLRMGTARQLCVSGQDSDRCAVLYFLIQNKLHWVLHLHLHQDVLWGPDNPPCLLLCSPLAITV